MLINVGSHHRPHRKLSSERELLLWAPHATGGQAIARGVSHWREQDDQLRKPPELASEYAVSWEGEDSCWEPH